METSIQAGSLETNDLLFFKIRRHGLLTTGNFFQGAFAITCKIYIDSLAKRCIITVNGQ